MYFQNDSTPKHNYTENIKTKTSIIINDMIEIKISKQTTLRVVTTKIFYSKLIFQLNDFHILKFILALPLIVPVV